MRLYVLIPAALLGLAPLGCGGSDPEPNNPSQMQNQYGASTQYPPGQYPPGQYGQPAPAGQYGQPAPAGQYGQPAGTPTTPTTPTTPAAGASGGQASPIAPTMVAAATPVLTAMAASEVQGMQAEGGAFAGQFQDGQTLEQPFNIQPGKCYSVIGVGVGLQELDIQLVAHTPPMPPVVLAQDSTTGPNATLGGKGQCFKNPLPIGGPAKAVLRARGSGMAVGQIYVK
ncbi:MULTISPECIES: hypothetical protein [unclassified Sorangium]|uniref:hypothetical protein n=1 Tax=unclassified Sorangium TaxID=2621164 RepID=UPI003F5B99CB